MTIPTPEFTRWFRLVYPHASDDVVAENWGQRPDGECEFWTELAAAPQSVVGPWPELLIARETIARQNEVHARLLRTFGRPDLHGIRHASVTAATLDRWGRDWAGNPEPAAGEVA